MSDLVWSEEPHDDLTALAGVAVQAIVDHPNVPETWCVLVTLNTPDGTGSACSGYRRGYEGAKDMLTDMFTEAHIIAKTMGLKFEMPKIERIRNQG